MADKLNVNPTPRQEFQSNKSWVTMHRDMMQQPMLSVSIQYALAELVRKQFESNSDGNAAAQAAYKIQGAIELIKTLRNLAEMPVELPKTKRNDQLTQT